MTARTPTPVVVLLLALCLCLAWTDRVAFSVATDAIRHELHLNDWQAGLLGGPAFGLLNAAALLPLAALADGGRRKRVIAASVAVWSLATAFTGRAHSLAALAAARVATGIGEAGVSPASASLVTAIAAPARRRGALGVLYGGGYVGLVAGFAGGGALVDGFGWRTTFVILGAIGLPVALAVVWLVPEPQPEPAVAAQSWRALAGNRQLRELLFYGMSGQVFAYAGLQWNAPFYERSFGLTAGEAGFWFGTAYGLAIVAGTFGGGWLADRAARRAATDPSAAMRVTRLAYLAGQPFLILAYLVPSEALSLACMVITMATSGLTAAPVYAAIQDAVPEARRTTAVALFGVTASLFGQALGPPLFGKLSDLLQPLLGTGSLRGSLLISAILGFIPALFLHRLVRLQRRAVRPTAPGAASPAPATPA